MEGVLSKGWDQLSLGGRSRLINIILGKGLDSRPIVVQPQLHVIEMLLNCSGWQTLKP